MLHAPITHKIKTTANPGSWQTCGCHLMKVSTQIPLQTKHTPQMTQAHPNDIGSPSVAMHAVAPQKLLRTCLKNVTNSLQSRPGRTKIPLPEPNLNEHLSYCFLLSLQIVYLFIDSVINVIVYHPHCSISVKRPDGL